MREIVLDTETTGLNPVNGDRIVEIGALELVNHLPTGNQFHKYINPQRDMPAEAFAVHGLSQEFLSDKPLFDQIAQEFAEFIQGDTLIKDAFNVDWFDLAAPIMKIENYFRMLLQEEVECDRLSIDMIVDKLIRHDQASIGVTYRKKQAYLQH